MSRWELFHFRAYAVIPTVSLVEVAARGLQRHYPYTTDKLCLFFERDEFEASSIHVMVWLRPRILLMEGRFKLSSVDDAIAVVQLVEKEFAAVEAEEDLRNGRP